MRTVVSILSILTLWACSSQKEISKNESSPPDKPNWTQSKPISSTHYVGIGVAQKGSVQDYRGVAKENALSDLASEIKVNVNSNSLLYTLEREYKFEQEFRETIRTSTDLDLEDFELVENWEDEDSYWLYYRLNKSAYAENQKQKKETAQALAVDFLAKAESAKEDGRYSESIDYYLRGLQSLEEFWAEKNEASYRGKTIFIGNELFGGVKSTLNGASIELTGEPILNFQNSYVTKAEVLVNNSVSGQPYASVPVNYVYQGEYGRVKGSLSSNVDGRITVPISEAERSSKPNVLTLAVNTEALFEPFEGDRFMKKLTKSLRGATQTYAISYQPPLVCIDATEKNLGEEMSSSPITAAIVASLNRKGVRFTEESKEADVIIKLESNTKTTGQSQGFSTVRLELEVNVIDARKNESVYKISKSDIKGVDLNFEKAGVRAYQNLTKNIESELMRKLANDLF
ncbi:MAG: LPP20 family lipoprotein [Flavobacteriales bacterium]|nr:LPP20 family lipoprotein [Flavobacteriales bacterium]